MVCVGRLIFRIGFVSDYLEVAVLPCQFPGVSFLDLRTLCDVDLGYACRSLVITIGNQYCQIRLTLFKKQGLKLPLTRVVSSRCFPPVWPGFLTAALSDR